MNRSNQTNRPKRTALSMGVACLLAAALVSDAGCRRATAPGSPTGGAGTVADSARFTTGLFEGCQPEGDGGDPDLNRLKNRDTPPPAYGEMTVADIVGNTPQAAMEAGTRHRASWPAEALSEIQPWENRGVSVEGYLLMVRQEGPESCNCHSQSRRDYHMWLAAAPEDNRDSSVVVEVSPRLMPAHPVWRLRILQRLARDRARVRISGWLMWDQEHPEQIGKTRGTLWEIHPIHRIEVYSGARWRDVE